MKEICTNSPHYGTSGQVIVGGRDKFNCAISDITETQQMAETLMKTPHYAKMGPEGIFAIVAKAKSLNVPVLDALNGGLYFVQGRVGMSSEMMASLIRQAGHSIIKDAKSDNSVCILHGKRKDNGDTWTVIFSIEDARRAGLMKNMYEKYPGVMLYNRCMSMLARQLYPDVIKGAGYTHEELKEIATNSSQDNYKVFSVEQLQVIDEKVSTEEAQEVMDILSECDEDYKHKVMQSLKKLEPPLTSLYDLPKKLYIRVLMAAKKRRAEILLQKEIELQPEATNEPVSG